MNSGMPHPDGNLGAHQTRTHIIDIYILRNCEKGSQSRPPPAYGPRAGVGGGRDESGSPETPSRPRGIENIAMRYSTYEEVCDFWAFLERLDSSEVFRVPRKHLARVEVLKLLDVLREWRPESSDHHHFMARTVLSYLNDWATHHRLGKKLMSDAARLSLSTSAVTGTSRITGSRAWRC